MNGSLIANNRAYLFKISNIGFYKAVVGRLGDVVEICEIARISEFVEIDNPIIGILVDHKSYDMAADETRAACHQYITFEITHLEASINC